MTSSNDIENRKKQFIEKANKIHNNKYGYSLVEYINNHTKIKIICPVHGEFLQRPHDHLNHHGCPLCKSEKIGFLKRDSREEFIEKARQVHGDKYDYSLVEYKSAHTKIKIICPIHGEFLQRPYSHLHNHGCLFCNESKGEKKIEKILLKENINFIRQYKINNCKNIKPLPFDFYLPDYNTCIEYQGEQHYKTIDAFGGREHLQRTQKHDQIKQNYCQQNNINLLEISYKDFRNIEKILKVNISKEI
jgi:very-short-patch-repair endonuclease